MRVGGADCGTQVEERDENEEGKKRENLDKEIKEMEIFNRWESKRVNH